MTAVVATLAIAVVSCPGSAAVEWAKTNNRPGHTTEAVGQPCPY
jgi:hypothetical protein